MAVILAIETSCDETACALLDSERGLLAEQIYSQWRRHAAYGGVVPEMASRDHLARLLPMVDAILKEQPRPTAIAYTAGPGLAGALLTGAATAQALALAWRLPVIAVNHLAGHLLSPLLLATPPIFPYLALLVSGGHTQLWLVEGGAQYRCLGDTLDDAAGEAFDKSAVLLGLGYPGGARLERLAATGNESALTLPSPAQNRYDFSFSGLKTAVRRAVDKGYQKADIAAAFQRAVAHGLARQVRQAVADCGVTQVAVVGGVAQNKYLYQVLAAACAEQQAACIAPHKRHCGDNAAMIAVAARYGEPTAAGGFDVYPRWNPDTLPDAIADGNKLK